MAGMLNGRQTACLYPLRSQEKNRSPQNEQPYQQDDRWISVQPFNGSAERAAEGEECFWLV